MIKVRELYPVGLRVGTSIASLSDAEQTQVRVGWDIHRLSQLQHEIWSVLVGAGSDDQAAFDAWTARKVADHYLALIEPRRDFDDERLPRPETITSDDVYEVVTELCRLGLAIETDGLREHLHTHRVVPLLAGIGNIGAAEGGYLLGMAGEPMLQITEPSVSLWQNGCRSADLAAAWGERDADGLNEAIRTLVRCGAAYLDVVSTPGSPSSAQQLFDQTRQKLRQDQQ